jgi:pyruvate kinase
MEILDAVDGIMVARGDLALSLPEEKVPSMQIELINACRTRRKPVIVATQMLESMITSPMPTRAEVNDVYTAAMQGADAVMLSGETANGKYPIDAVRTMDRIVKEAEKELNSSEMPVIDIKDVIARSAINMAESFGCNIISPTVHGTTPAKLSRQRPRATVYCITPNQRTLKYMNFFYGVIAKKGSYEPVFKNFDKLKKMFDVQQAVFVFGYPPNNQRTNTIIYM